MTEAQLDGGCNLKDVSYTQVEQALNEIKEFISILYGTCIRFYKTLLFHTELDEMREDLIETVTTMLFHQEDLTDLVIQLCKIATKDEEKKFERRLREAIELNLLPSKMAVSNYFTLDKTSMIEEFYSK